MSDPKVNHQISGVGPKIPISTWLRTEAISTPITARHLKKWIM